MKKYKHIPTGDFWFECKSPIYKELIYNKKNDCKLPIIYTKSNDWEEIIEKPTYNIESLYYKDNIYVKNLLHTFIGIKGGFITLDTFENNRLSNIKINSVKRLIDNQIFTLLDKTNQGIIKKFEIQGDMIRVYFNDKQENYHLNLDQLTLKKLYLQLKMELIFIHIMIIFVLLK